MIFFLKAPSLRRVTKGTTVGKFSYAGATVVQGFYPINVSGVFGGYNAEDSQFIIQITV